METQFYVGQEVVAIEDHSQGHFKKGDEFVVKGIKKPCCSLLLDIGIKLNGYTSSLCVCGKERPFDNYFNSTSFAPKQQLSETTYNDIKEWIKQGKELAILN